MFLAALRGISVIHAVYFQRSGRHCVDICQCNAVVALLVREDDDSMQLGTDNVNVGRQVATGSLCYCESAAILDELLKAQAQQFYWNVDGVAPCMHSEQ